MKSVSHSAKSKGHMDLNSFLLFTGENTVPTGSNFTEQRPFCFLFLEELHALYTVLRLVTLIWQNVGKKGTFV